MSERDPDHEHGDYGKGQEDEKDRPHTGSYAEGEQSEDHAHGDPLGGDFAEGQEAATEEHEHHEGDFAEGQEDESKHEH